MTNPNPGLDLTYLKETAQAVLRGDDTSFAELEYSIGLGTQQLLEDARNGSSEALDRMRLIVVLLDQDVQLSDLLYALGDALQTATSTTPVQAPVNTPQPPPRAGQTPAPAAQPVAPTRAPQTTQALPDPATLLQPTPAAQPAATPQAPPAPGGRRPARAPQR